MQRLRNIRRFVHLLVALFAIAQFAGVVSSPLASADAFDRAVASHAHRQHMHHQAGTPAAGQHDDQDRNHTDHCCALHAFFAGVLPAAIAVEAVTFVSQPMTVSLSDLGLGVAPARLDRPPRPVA